MNIFNRISKHFLRTEMIVSGRCFLPFLITHFFYKQPFYKQRPAEIGKKSSKCCEQHPEAEPLLFENYSHSSSMLSFKNNRRYSKK